MRIEILCKPEAGERGQRVLANVRQALKEMDVRAEVHLFCDRRKMVDNRVYVAPALLIDDVVRISGRVPEVSEIKSFIVERPRYVNRMQDVA
ncbi:MAG: thioredoxin family protein [Gammaproteobacteria bacterium]|nr:thioredoxin family protein [Gammaproteobacteria bacterium]